MSEIAAFADKCMETKNWDMRQNVWDGHYAFSFAIYQTQVT